MVNKNFKLENPGRINNINVNKRWYRTHKESLPPLSGLPPLGNSILNLLVSYYGSKEVAKAAQMFVELEDREYVLMDAKKDIDKILDKIKRENGINYDII